MQRMARNAIPMEEGVYLATEGVFQLDVEDDGVKVDPAATLPAKKGAEGRSDCSAASWTETAAGSTSGASGPGGDSVVVSSSFSRAAPADAQVSSEVAAAQGKSSRSETTSPTASLCSCSSAGRPSACRLYYPANSPSFDSDDCESPLSETSTSEREVKRAGGGGTRAASVGSNASNASSRDRSRRSIFRDYWSKSGVGSSPKSDAANGGGVARAIIVPSAVLVPPMSPRSPVGSFDEESPCLARGGPTSPKSLPDRLMDDPQRYRLQMQRQQILPSYCGKYLFSPAPSPLASSSGGRRGGAAALHVPPSPTLAPKPRSILRRHASDRDDGGRARRRHCSGPRLPSLSQEEEEEDSSSILSLRRAQSDSLRAIEDIRECVYGLQDLPPPPFCTAEGDREDDECSSDSGSNRSGGGGGGSNRSGSGSGSDNDSSSDDGRKEPVPSTPTRISAGKIDREEAERSLGTVPMFSPRPRAHGMRSPRGGNGLDGGPLPTAKARPRSPPPPPPPPPLWLNGPPATPSRRERSCSVHFDPRVSVLEYLSPAGAGGPQCRGAEDGGGNGGGAAAGGAAAGEDPNWFTADELERFKTEAVVLAQKFYLLSSAYAAQQLQAKGRGGGGEDAATREERAARAQQIWQSGRRKALFANPALRATEEDRVVFEGSRELYLLLAAHIRNVMVVDPHDVFLDLFYRYFKNMIPHANIVTVKSGEDALRRLKGGRPHGEGGEEREPRRTRREGFDIIIVEERLHQCWLSRNLSDASGGSASPSSSDDDERPWARRGSPQSRAPAPAFAHLEEEEEEERCRQQWQSAGEDQGPERPRLRARPMSGSQLRARPMSGSQLLCRINLLQDEQRRSFSSHRRSVSSSPHRRPAAAAAPTPPPRRSLLIGVSGWLGEDCEKLQRGGADMLWGKPPPVMDGRLRNELLTALLAKRGHPVFICD